MVVFVATNHYIYKYNGLEEVNVAKQLLKEKMSIFKMMHEIKCAGGKSSSNESRMESLNEIQTLYDKIGYKTSLHECMIR